MTIWPDVQSEMLFKSKACTSTEVSQNSLVSNIAVIPHIIPYICLCSMWLKFAKDLDLGDQIALKFSRALVLHLLGPLEIPAKNSIARVRPQYKKYQSWS